MINSGIIVDLYIRLICIVFLFKKLDYVIVNELIHNSKNSGYMKIIILKTFL